MRNLPSREDTRLRLPVCGVSPMVAEWITIYEVEKALVKARRPGAQEVRVAADRDGASPNPKPGPGR